MVLGFKQKFPDGTPTHFREKVLASLGHYPEGGRPSILLKDGEEIIIKPKYHSLRLGNRWKAGMNIHMAYGVRTKNYQQFNKGIPELEKCVSVQKVEIKWTKTHSGMLIFIDGVNVGGDDLWRNDGFDSLEQFMLWFNKDFTGQIIHWSSLRY